MYFVNAANLWPSGSDWIKLNNISSFAWLEEFLLPTNADSEPPLSSISLVGVVLLVCQSLIQDLEETSETTTMLNTERVPPHLSFVSVSHAV
jgi:hypothetical protein